MPLAQAQVSLLDRGFLFADGIYEVIPVYGGRAFALGAHLARLARSLRELAIANPMDDVAWAALIHQLIEANRPSAGADQLVYLQVTRGAPARRAHVFPADTAPTVIGMSNALPAADPAALREGVAALTLADARWARCDIKSIALLPNVLATQAAREAGCNEAILHRDGRVTEGSSSNVFAVLGNTVVTPAKGPEILPGVTRDVLVELLRGDGLKVEERRIDLGELRSAGEIWITSSSREVLPVTRLDGKPVGDGKPGAVWHKAWGLLRATIKC